DILIWGGATATGQYAIQLAKLSGLRVISTASPKNFDFLKSLGADEVFDYSDSKTARKVSQLTGGRLKHAVDCISDGMTPNPVSTCLSKEGGTIATLLPYQSKKPGVKTELVLLYSINGKALEFPFPYPAHPEHRDNGVEYCKMITRLLVENLLKPCPVKLVSSGLAGVREGFDYMKQGKVHAEKITYRIADTPGIKDIRERELLTR
ncbi:hypothetical protein M422DRAFT_192471, partial [Sphaerobolus stellatus SS14]